MGPRSGSCFFSPEVVEEYFRRGSFEIDCAVGVGICQAAGGRGWARLSLPPVSAASTSALTAPPLPDPLLLSADRRATTW